MAYSAKAVANYFLDRGFDEEDPIDPLKLQKLLYFAHGWNLGLYGEPLLSESVQAWKYGPVIPSIYHEFKEVGSDPIDWNAKNPGETPRSAPRVPMSDQRTRALLDRVWKVYGKFSGLSLSEMTHKPATPWAITWKQAQRDTAIPDRLIQTYFTEQAARTRQFPT